DTVIKHLENHFYKNTGFFNFGMFSNITDNIKILIHNVNIKLIFKDQEYCLNIEKMNYSNTDESFNINNVNKSKEYGYKLVNVEKFSFSYISYLSGENWQILKPVNMKLEVKIKNQVNKDEFKFNFNLILDSIEVY